MDRSPPFEKYTLFRTGKFGKVQCALAVRRPHRVECLDASTSVDFRLHGVPVGWMSVAVLTFGAEVSSDVGQFGMYAVFNLDLQGFGGDLRTYLIDNPVHHIDPARYFLSELSDLQAHVTELPGFGHAVAAIAKASSGAVCTFNLCTTASWNQRNEYAEIYGKGHAVWVDNVDTCTYQPPEHPEQVWRPNYTVPTPGNSGPTTMGFVPELEHLRDVATGNAENLSGITSAAATLALAEQLCDIAGS